MAAQTDTDQPKVKGSHPNAAANAEKNIRYLVIPAGTITYASAREAHQAAPNGGTVMRTHADQGEGVSGTDPEA